MEGRESHSTFPFPRQTNDVVKRARRQWVVIEFIDNRGHSGSLLLPEVEANVFDQDDRRNPDRREPRYRIIDIRLALFASTGRERKSRVFREN